MKETLFTLLNCYGGSGREDAVRETIAELARPYCDEVRTDALGNLICVRAGKENGRRIMVSAHMDHIGFIVTHIDKKGFLRVHNVGGINRANSLNRRVVFANGVNGVLSHEVEDFSPANSPMSKLFIDIVRRLQDNPTIEIGMNERFIFNIVSGASVMNVAGQDGDLYPALPALTDVSEFTLPQDSLRGMIEKTQFAIAVDDAREVLTGALLEISGGDATMVALDGFRMAYKREKVSDVMDVISAIIPGRVVGDLAKLLSGGEDAFATLAFSGNDRLQIRLEKTDVYVTLISGEYINYRRLLPTSFKMRAVAALEPLRQCIDRAALMARESSSNLLRFRLHEGILEIESNSQLGDAHEEMPLEELDGGELTIAFNVRYMQDVVRTVDAEKIILNFNDSLSPCVITPENDLDYVHLVLPVRTGYSS